MLEDEIFCDSIVIINEEGKWVWIYFKKFLGIFYKYWKLVSYVLLVMLFVFLFIKVNGN